MRNLLALLSKHKDKIGFILFITYTLFILYYALLSRSTRDFRLLELRFMWAYREMLTGHPEWKEDVGYNLKNILFFMPFGFLFPKYTFKIVRAKEWLTILCCSALLSVAIEITQYVFCLGLCELDDVLCNGLGGLIGYWLYLSLNHHISIYNKHEF